MIIVTPRPGKQVYIPYLAPALLLSRRDYYMSPSRKVFRNYF